MIKKVVFWLVFLSTFFIRLVTIKGGDFPFTIDQGRDMIDIRSIAVGHKLRLIGPTTSINGVYLGPFWYYFNLPAFVLGQGDPTSLLVWQIFFYHFVGLLIYFLLDRGGKDLGFFLSLFYLIAPIGFTANRYSWNANAMPAFTALYLLLLYLTFTKPTSRRVIFLGLTSGLAFQIEAAFGVFFFPFALLVLLVRTRNLRLHLLNLGAFLLTLAPQAIFELRHNFPLTHAFISEVSGTSHMLGVGMSLNARILDRLTALQTSLVNASHVRPHILLPIFIFSLIAFIFLVVKKNLDNDHRRILKITAAFLIFSFFSYLFFPSALKNWYTFSWSVVLALLLGVMISSFSHSKFTPLRFLAIAVMVFALLETYSAQIGYAAASAFISSQNKSSLKNSLQTIDWVYQHAGSQGFVAYSYLPSVYDYPYQYLYWWYGKNKYGYVPNDVAYLPGQPEYIDNRTTYFTPLRPLPDSKPTFLVIEKETANPAFETAWLGNFSKLCSLDKTAFPYGVEVKKLGPCLAK